MIALSSVPELLHTLSRSRSILLGAYRLQNPNLLHALQSAARDGAHVRVFLQKGGAASAALRASGAGVKLVEGLHMKAAICGRQVFLSDRNWAGSDDVIVRDTNPSDVAAIRSALRGRSAHASNVQTTKVSALQAEAHLIDTARRSVRIQSESFSDRWPIYSALVRARSRGVRCELAVNSAEVPGQRKVLRELAAAGIHVRDSGTNEKLAVADGKRGWVGSANATSPWPHPDAAEWGLATHSSSIVEALRTHFVRNWRSGTLL